MTKRGGAGLAIALDAAGDLDGQRAEEGDQLAGAGEAVDVHDEGREHGRGDVADAAEGVQVVGLRQRALGGNQQVFQAFLPRAGIAELAHLLADQFGGRAPRQ